jgi:hypothetical protein
VLDEREMRHEGTSLRQEKPRSRLPDKLKRSINRPLPDEIVESLPSHVVKIA